jgi:phosphate-selective porin OprO/OprP
MRSGIQPALPVLAFWLVISVNPAVLADQPAEAAAAETTSAAADCPDEPLGWGLSAKCAEAAAPAEQGQADVRSAPAPAAAPGTESSPEEERQEASLAISENAQGAFLLRHLLLGRQFQLFGKLEGEIALYDIPTFIDQSGGDIRSFRVGIAGLNPWLETISYKLEFDLTDGDSSISSAYINADFGGLGFLTVGNQDGSQSLSASTGRLSQLFMESPLPIEAFGLGKRVGISYERHGERYGLYGLVFGRDLNTDAKHKGVAARAYYNPVRSRGGVWHLGLSLIRENIRDTARLSSRPESHVTDIKLVDTGNYEDVASDRRLGFELAGATGSLTTRAEVMLNHWKRLDGSRNRFKGAYIEGGYFLTGQPFRYVRGKFVRPQLDSSRSAWELAFRWSWLDLNDGDVEGGEERNLGLALNYYPRPDLRGQLNLIHVNSDRPASDGWLLQGRLQFNW